MGQVDFEIPSCTYQNDWDPEHKQQLMLVRMWRRGNTALWSKGHTSPLLWGVQTCAVILEVSMVDPQKLAVDLTQNPAIHSWPYTQTILNHTTRTLAQLCSKQLYLL